MGLQRSGFLGLESFYYKLRMLDKPRGVKVAIASVLGIIVMSLLYPQGYLPCHIILLWLVIYYIVMR